MFRVSVSRCKRVEQSVRGFVQKRICGHSAMGQAKSKAAVIVPDPVKDGVPAALCGLYKAKILPLEQHFDYEFVDGPYLNDAEFSSKPSVLFVGQYSVGKTTVIQYLIGEDIPGSRIGPEPTTDTFTFVTFGESKRVIPGTSLIGEANFPFKGLAKFGAPFLSKCNAATCSSAILKSISFIDTPGILSGEKQRVSRRYDFEQIISYLAEKVDRILLLFDAHKLDISDEFKRSIQALQGNEEKVKIVLNKVDSMEPSSLNRVIGALMWSLSKVLRCAEVPRLFIGSFWDRPIRHPQYREVFEADTKALFEDLRSLPRSVNVRRINDVVKRARQIKVFAFLMDEMSKSIGIFCQEQGKLNSIERMDTKIYFRVVLNYRVPMADLPSAPELKKKLISTDHKKWKRMDKKTKELLANLDEFVNKDVTRLISALPADSQISITDHGPLGNEANIFSGEQEFEWQWSTVMEEANKHKWQNIFESLKPTDGKLFSNSAKPHMEKSGLPSAVLAQIWRLIDIDKDNRITLEEFYLMNYLINRQIAGKPLPRQLPPTILPLPPGFGEQQGTGSQSALHKQT